MNKKMCHLCGGNLCGGTSTCSVVVQHAPEVIKISYNTIGNYFMALQSYVLAIFVSTKDSLLKTMKYIKIKI